MSSIDQTAGSPFASARSRPGLLRLAPALYAATLFSSALLLFAVQPMFTKIVLPRLGGSPSVWSVAMVFFQSALLAGYAYAHALTRTLAPGRVALVHMLLLAAAAATLPIAVAAGFGAPPTDSVAVWLFALFAASIGLPFMALSASAPLLQSWFAASGHPQAGNPYVLYGASNLGSFAALIAYPAVIEPLLTLKMQTYLWSAGFAVVALLIAASGLVIAVNATRMTTSDAEVDEAPSWPMRARWMALAAVPSGLTIAITAHITTDVAAAPFLWVIPLALYLLTFVAIFRDRPWIPHARVVWLTPFVVAPLAVGVVGVDKVFWLAVILLNLAAFVILTLLCHGSLYASRPAPARLTAFYLWVSLGGVLGGAFAGLTAPYIFSGTYEYPILIVAALLAMPGALRGGPRTLAKAALPALGLAAALLVARLLTDANLPASWQLAWQVSLILLVAAMLLLREQPARFASLAVLAFVVTEFWRPGGGPTETVRSFFGVHRVIDLAEGRARVLYHGTTIHGVQRLRAEDGSVVTGRPEPLAYYWFGGAIGEGIAGVRSARGRLDRVALVGLGTGSLACHRKDGERWTFFEIDARVVELARDPQRFSFLASCAPESPVIIGDARLTLAAQPGVYDLLVLDAFSSDVVPAHLLTREAFVGYLSKLTAHGAIVAHISNRHMELAPVLEAVGQSLGLVAFLKEDAPMGGSFFDTFKSRARVVALARNPADLGNIVSNPDWKQIAPDPAVHAWTDDYSNLIQAIWRKKTGR